MKTISIYPLVLFIVLLTFFNPFNTSAQNDKFVVVLDAGHGGHDPGKPYKKGFHEKNIALSVVLKVGKILEKNKDIKVVYTRKTDVFVDLFKRGKVANDANADLFVSVHCNASASKQAHGSETYVLGVHRNETNLNVAKAENSVIYLEDNHQETYKGYDPNKPESLIGLTLAQEEYLDQSILLASLVEGQFKNNLKRKSRGVKQAGFIVLHQTVMPSILVETGFVTNTEEAKYLSSLAGQKKLSESISAAILKYKSSLYVNNSEPEIKNSSTPNSSELNTENSTIYKVQIAASKNNLAAKSFNFKGLKAISKEKTGDIYRYFSGETYNYSEIEQLKTEAINKGYKSAYIVSYKNGKRIK
jgi:N-acetylmuramoyl-L-alanine amidase